MKEIFLRFYEELNNFLPSEKRKTQFKYISKSKQSIKDIIESCGVPHTQVDLILVNGKSVDFSYIAKDGDRISVYPVFESVDIKDITNLRPEPLREIKFILDRHLGKLARLLRMLGFDTKYDPSIDREQLIKKSKNEGRIIISRSRELMKNNEVTHGYCLTETAPGEQLKKILSRFDLTDEIIPFSRCFICNSTLESIEKSEIVDRLPPKVRKSQQDFTICPNCNKLYWKGSHYKMMKNFIENLINELKKENSWMKK